MVKKDIAKLLNGKKIIRGKISFSIVLGQIVEEINYAPKYIFSEQTLEEILFRISKIENVLTQITLNKNYKRKAFKELISKIELNVSESEKKGELISDFLKDLDKSTEDLKEKIVRDIIDVKDKFSTFIETDVSKPEKTRFVKEVIDVYTNFVEEQLKKGRQVDTPIGKYTVKTNKRFGTMHVTFDVNAELKKYLLENSPKNRDEIEKQRELISKNILEQDKHLDRLNKPKKKED